VTIRTWAAVMVLAVGCLSVGTVRAQDQGGGQPGEPPAGGMPDMAAMMEKWLATARPGEHHKFLEHFVGNWNTTTNLLGGGPPIETKGKSQVKWILDGRFIMEEMDGQFMMPGEGGQMTPVPFKGVGLTGYDNYRNMYVASWVDNLGTHLLTMKGAKDPASNVLTAYGEMDEPMLNVTGRTVKYVSRVIDQDKHVFEIYDLAVSEGHKVLEITYERAK